MARLKNRNMQIPNGLTFYQPETKWQPQRGASFDVIVNSLISHRQANSYLVQKNGWPVDYNTVADEVDAFNAAICERMGWTAYITPGGGPPLQMRPQHQPSLSGSAGRLVVGAKTLVEWIKSGAEAVPGELAAKRAAVCATCPQNGKGPLESFFTRPLSEAIRKAIASRGAMGLSTPSDDKLNVCEACGCPLKLKVHLPLQTIKSKMSAESLTALDVNCWITHE